MKQFWALPNNVLQYWSLDDNIVLSFLKAAFGMSLKFTMNEWMNRLFVFSPITIVNDNEFIDKRMERTQCMHVTS